MFRTFALSLLITSLVAPPDALAQPRASDLNITGTVVKVSSSRRLTVRDAAGKTYQIDAKSDIASNVNAGDTISVSGSTLDGKRIGAANVTWVRDHGLILPANPRILRSVSLTKSSVCPGEEIEVNVTAQHPAGAGRFVNVTINGYPSRHRFLHLTGRPGIRLIHIAGATEEGSVESLTKKVKVKDCPAVPFYDVRTRFNPYHPYMVDFLVVNHEPGTRGYRWDFGDGRSTTTDEPFVSHDYSRRVGYQEPYYTFEVSVGIPQRKRRTRNVVTVHSPEYRDMQHDLVQPRVSTSAQMEQRGRRYSGAFSIQNITAEPLLFDRAFIEYQYCDPDRRSTYTTTTPADVIFHGGRDDVPRSVSVTPPASGVGPTTPSTPVISSSPIAPATPPTALATAGPTPSPLPLPSPSPSPSPTPTTLSPPTSPAVPTPAPPPVTAVAVGAGTGSTTAPPPTRTGTTAPPATGTRVVTPPSIARTVNVTLATTTRIAPSGALVAVNTVTIPGKSTHSGFIRLLAPSLPGDVCGIAYHLVGETPSGSDIFASLYYELRHNPYLTAPVTNARMRTFLNELVRRRLVEDSAEISQETFYRLRQEGKIRDTAGGWEVVP